MVLATYARWLTAPAIGYTGRTASRSPRYGISQGSQVSKMRLENNGVFTADYVPASPGTPIA